MTVLKVVNTYKKLIQSYLVANPQADERAVLEHLVLDYLRNYPVANRSIFTQKPDSVSLARSLAKALYNNDDNILGLINESLKENEIKKTDDFFALLIAYFYYFEDLYTNQDLQTHIALYKHILVPLHLYRERLEQDRMSFLLEKTADMNESICSHACQVLEEFAIPKGWHDAVVAKLLDRLNDTDLWVRYYACAALGKIALPENKKEAVIKKLIIKLNDPDSLVRIGACEALRKIPSSASQRKAVIAKLLQNLHDKDKWIRCHAIEGLGKYIRLTESQSEMLVNVLLQKLEDEEPYVRNKVCQTLRNIAIPERQHEAVAAKLITKLDDQSYFVRFDAYDTLVKIFSSEIQRKMVGDKLLETLDDPALCFITYHILKANPQLILESQKEEFVVKLLEKMDPITDGTSDIWLVLEKLQLSESRREALMVKLLNELDNPREPSRLPVYAILQQISLSKRDSEVAVGKLLERLNGSLMEVGQVCIVLATISPSESQHDVVVAKLLEKLNGPDKRNRLLASIALERIGVSQEQFKLVVATLLEALNDPNVMDSNFTDACKTFKKIFKAKKQIVSEYRLEAVIAKLLEEIDDENMFPHDACDLLGKIALSENKCETIFIELGKKLAHIKNPIHSAQVNKTLLALYKEMPAIKRIAMIARIEGALHTVTDPKTLILLTHLLQSCQRVNAAWSSLVQYLPPEKASEVMERVVGIHCT